MSLEPAQAVPDLADPLLTGESLEWLAKRMDELSATYCVDCGNDHVRWVRHRRSEEKGSFLIHFPELAGALLHAVKLLHAGGASRLDIMIAGCADTGLLALCAHIVGQQGAFAQDQVRLHVIDRCRTPLILCEEFAALHGLAVTTTLCKIPKDEPGLTANLILADSLLRFFPREEQLDVTKYLARHHAVGGALVYGQILARTPPMAERPGSSADPGDIRAVIAEAGYEFEQETVTDRHFRLTSGAPQYFRRYVAVATKVIVSSLPP